LLLPAILPLTRKTTLVLLGFANIAAGLAANRLAKTARLEELLLASRKYKRLAAVFAG